MIYAHAVSGFPTDDEKRAALEEARVTKSIDGTLEERGSRYGAFSGHAEITMGIKAVIDLAILRRPDGTFTDSQIESLHMIAHKIGRILNGDPNYDDSWVDIAGYSQLIVQQLHATNED